MFNTTKHYTQQDTTAQSFLKGCYDEIVCMQAFADKQTAVKAMLKSLHNQEETNYDYDTYDKE